MDQLERVTKCLDNFCAASGQKVSITKTKVFFSKNVSASLAEDISRRSGFQITKDMGKYLGVPLLHQKVTKNTYSYLIENKLLNRKYAEKVSRLES